MLRKCTGCGKEAHTESELENFTPHITAKYNRRNWCKECDAIQSAINYRKTKERTKQRKKEWVSKNRAKVCSYTAKRRALKLNATPSWADFEEIQNMYLEAKYHQMELDHIVPLNSPVVCGLHWEGNLQLLTREDNVKKGNKLIEVDY